MQKLLDKIGSGYEAKISCPEAVGQLVCWHRNKKNGH